MSASTIIRLESVGTTKPPVSLPSLLLVNPPPLEGYSNERTYSGGIGVSRKLKPGEKEAPVILPIDFLYTAAVAEAAGSKVQFADLLLERLSGDAALSFCARLVGAETMPGWVGVRLSMPSLLQDLDFANALKRRLPGSKLFVFGTVIMATLDHWVRRCEADYVIYGEPEALIGELLAAEDPEEIAGVVAPSRYTPLVGEDLYDEAKATARYDSWVKVENLSALPRPAWHLLEMGRYAPDGSGDSSKVGVFVQASRGCPIACTMCPYMLLEGKPWRNNEIETVVDELEYLNKTFGIYRVRFRDPNFGFNRKYARELCEAIVRRGVKLEATVETSLEVFDEDNLRKMREAGIKTITTGIETNDPACMESIGQKIAVNSKLREKVDLCHKLGFHIYGTYCLGTPEETWETVRKTWQFANELGVESGFTVMTPFPGTPMYWRALREGLIPKRMQFSDWNSYTATMRTHAMTTKDLGIARLWARLETILPYRRKRAIRRGGLALWKHYAKFLPHYVARQYCRAYARARAAGSSRSPAR